MLNPMLSLCATFIAAALLLPPAAAPAPGSTAKGTVDVFSFVDRSITTAELNALMRI